MNELLGRIALLRLNCLCAVAMRPFVNYFNHL